METKICESCGMPMKKIEDFGGQNSENNYCKYCTYENGELKTFNEKLEDFKTFIMKANDFGEEQALKLAKENLIKMPAWKHIRIDD
jgi:hypothetical protein